MPILMGHFERVGDATTLHHHLRLPLVLESITNCVILICFSHRFCVEGVYRIFKVILAMGLSRASRHYLYDTRWATIFTRRFFEIFVKSLPLLKMPKTMPRMLAFPRLFIICARARTRAIPDAQPFCQAVFQKSL